MFASAESSLVGVAHDPGRALARPLPDVAAREAGPGASLTSLMPSRGFLGGRPLGAAPTPESCKSRVGVNDLSEFLRLVARTREPAKDNGDSPQLREQSPYGGGISGTGDVEGPASSTDNAIARYDGTTGKRIQNSKVLVDDGGHVLGINGAALNPAISFGSKTDAGVWYDASSNEVALQYAAPGNGAGFRLAEGYFTLETRDTSGGLSLGNIQIASDGAFQIMGVNALGTTDGAIVHDGSGNIVYTAGTLHRFVGNARFNNDVKIDGELTVDGLIDPTGLELNPQTSNPGNVAANTLWINDPIANDPVYHGSFRMSENGDTLSNTRLLMADANQRIVNSNYSQATIAILLAPACFYGYHGATSSIPHATWTQVELDQTLFDTDGLIQGSPSYDVGPLAGYYQIDWGVTIQSGDENPLMVGTLGMLTSRIKITQGETVTYVRGSNYNWDDAAGSWPNELGQDPEELPRSVGSTVIYAEGEAVVELEVFWEDAGGGVHVVAILDGESFSFLSGHLVRNP